MSTHPSSSNEFTPEQRKLLAKAYRLILSWKREEPEKNRSALSTARKPSKSRSVTSSLLPPQTEEGEKQHA